ncbi:cbb3-type cytochrome oxidase assembly protein CcoS [Marinicella sp. W31]|uniref:cbb3-type cytochrome oxidase assembly protein CcoS n=1 Tax=Marinicella sp. W31 TaxID=3023713 RepID=UPI0037570222
MSAIYILIPITLLILGVAVAIFFWAVNSDQYSDLDKAAHQILFERRPQQEKQQEKDNHVE